MRDEEIYGPLGRAIADRRSKIPLTQQQLADMVGVSRASIANTERGRQTVSVHNLYAIANALKLEDPSELLPPLRCAASGVEVRSPYDEISLSQAASLRKLVESMSTREGVKVRK